MRNERDRDRYYEDYNRDYRNARFENPRNWRYEGPDRDAEGYPRYNPKYDHYRQEGRHVGTHEDSYNEMYSIANYSDNPRPAEYGLHHSAESELDRVGYFPYAEGPYAGRQRNYSYSQGYNPNYDNPEEGDRYRDFDSRGNHGFRHDPGYGVEGGMRDFGNDHYGDRDRTGNGNRNYGHFGGYNR